jgi:alpha-N-arabinofuranosidase
MESARIVVNPDRPIGPVDPRIFSGFIEHLGRCIYGGIYDEGSPLSDAQGFRQDVLEALRALRLPVLRWPGGNFVSGYHWTDGIGPQDQRPRRRELAWHAEESNRFGTDEFIAYCRTLGTAPYICANLGSGTLDEAKDWVEYCNGTGNTYWVEQRRANGHPEPYDVIYWGLGNEMYGRWQIGALSAEDYVKKAIEFAKVMKLTDPRIQLISCGRDGISDWDRIVLEGLAPYVDFHSIHLYTGSDDYRANVLAPHHADRALRVCAALIERVRYAQRIDHPIYVAYDEWNVWYRARGAESQLEERYDLSDALAVATYLNVFIRHGQTVRMANLAQMVNVIAPIFTRPDGLFLQTIYHPLRLYAQHLHQTALDVEVRCDTYDLPPETTVSHRTPYVADLGPFKLLDVVATGDEGSRAVTVAVVNRDPSRDLPASLSLTSGRFTGEAVAYTVNGPDPHTINSFEQPRAVEVHEQRLAPSGASREYTFPAHSVTVLRLGRAV